MLQALLYKAYSGTSAILYFPAFAAVIAGSNLGTLGRPSFVITPSLIDIMPMLMVKPQLRRSSLANGGRAQGLAAVSNK